MVELRDVSPKIRQRQFHSQGTFAYVLGQVKGNNCKVQLQLVVAGPVLLPTPGQGETRDEEFWGNLGEITSGSSGHLLVLLWLWLSSIMSRAF